VEKVQRCASQHVSTVTKMFATKKDQQHDSSTPKERQKIQEKENTKNENTKKKKTQKKTTTRDPSALVSESVLTYQDKLKRPDTTTTYFYLLYHHYHYLLLNLLTTSQCTGLLQSSLFSCFLSGRWSGHE
jgi:hypothetical protein